MDTPSGAELLGVFRRNCPFVVRDDRTALGILTNGENKIIAERGENGELRGVSVINRDTILLLCVEREFRGGGVGSRLLMRSEDEIRRAGFHKATVGAGFDYLAPGVPTSRRYYPAVNENLYDGLDASASDFFERRGYRHSWDCDCFDMRFKLADFRGAASVGDEIGGIRYRWAREDERAAVVACVESACEEFAEYYENPALYRDGSAERALVALCGGEPVGALIVETDAESGLGSVGCTSVRPDFRGRKIATNMVKIGTKHLRDAGMTDAYLSYTYSGLDKLYGEAGYRICAYFMMAEKEL